MTPHWVFKGLTDFGFCLTILFSIALGAMWARSYFVSDYWAWGRDGWLRLVRLDSGAAWVEAMIGLNPFSQTPFQHQTKSAQRKEGAAWVGPLWISIDHRAVDTPIGTVNHLAGTVPYWLIVLVVGVAPAFVMMHVRRRANRTSRQRMGRCPACGYDLRATPDRCPECGNASR